MAVVTTKAAEIGGQMAAAIWRINATASREEPVKWAHKIAGKRPGMCRSIFRTHSLHLVIVVGANILAAKLFASFLLAPLFLVFIWFLFLLDAMFFGPLDSLVNIDRAPYARPAIYRDISHRIGSHQFFQIHAQRPVDTLTQQFELILRTCLAKLKYSVL